MSEPAPQPPPPATAPAGPRTHNFPSLHEIAAHLPSLTWLWPGWIPRGLLSLLGSAPGAGKTYLGLDLSRRVTAGQNFPDGSPVPRPGANVIYVDAENVPQIISQRATAWGMDTSRLYLMQPQDSSIDLSQERDWRHLIQMAYHLDPALIVVDSLSSISRGGENNVQDVRTVLSRLTTLAQNFQCGLLLIHHLRKRGLLSSRDVLSIDDFRGSSHITAMARSVLGLSIIQTGPEPDHNGPRRLEIVKTNLARHPKPLGIEFLPGQLTGVVLQYGEPPSPYRPPTRADECAAWLLHTLEEAGKPTRPHTIVALGKRMGFGRATIYKARRMLGARIRNTKTQNHPGNMWEL